MRKYYGNEFSQNGEDFIIAECIKRIKPTLLHACEFGAADGYYCSNTAALLKQGWTRQLFDIHGNEEAVVEKAITPENVNESLAECSILSIDIDGNDYKVWEAYNGKPDIVIIEINSSVDPEAMAPVSDPDHGTGYLPMKLLGESKGYFLLCHTGNLIFILNKHNELFPDADETFNTSFLC